MDEQTRPDDAEPTPSPPTPTPAEAPPVVAEAARGGTATRVLILLAGAIGLGVLAWNWTPEGGGGDAPPVVSTDGTTTPDPEPEAAPPVSPIVVTIVSALDDRFMSEPCSRVPGGGLFAVRASMDLGKRFLPNGLGVFMGDVTQAPGLAGRITAEYTYGEVLPETGIDVVAAGEGELGLGSGFVREVLTRAPRVTVLCANAVSPEGSALLRGWGLMEAGDRRVLVVAVAGESVGYELIRRGSDVRIAPPIEHARTALADGIARAAELEMSAASSILLVHGTVDEAADIVREVDGFDFVVAADGPILPRLEPLEVNGVPIHYSGRGARFSWRVVLADNEDLAQANLSRIGGRITAMGSPYNSRMAALRRLLRRDILPTAADGPDERPIDPRGEYAGTKECAECHAEQAAAHAESDHAAVIATYLADDFSGSTGCAGCHVTAPYHRGGWAPEEDDRGMGGIGCEACHGPGADHVASPTPGYGAVNLARCYDCHLPDRTPGFDAAASWAVTAHGALPPPPAPPSNDDDARRDDDPPKDDDSDADDPARDDPARDD